MAKPSTRDELAGAIARTLVELGRRNEIRLAEIRLATTALGTGLSMLSCLHPDLGFSYPQFPGSLLAISVGLMLVSLVFHRVLSRGWFVPALPYLAAVLDAAAITVFYVAVRVVRVEHQTVQLLFTPPLGALCTVFAASGGLRANGPAAIWTGLLALLSYILLASLLAVPLAAIVTVSGYILIGGLLGYWMSGLTRSSVAGAVGRVTLERFLPRQVLEGALIDPLALLSTPRTLNATVLVSDLRGFTALAESLPPAEVLAFLSEIQGELANAVRANGGVVDKFMGDGMLAVFGAPEADPEHSRRAVQAATDALAAIVQINVQRAQRGQPSVRIGIGIHSGPVVVGCLGAGQRLEFTVIGDTVNIASRLEALTKEKAVEVLLSGETARRVSDFPLRAMGSLDIRGRVQPLEVFTLGG